MTTETDPIKDAAERYIERGFRVIPLHAAHGKRCSCEAGMDCESMGKHPIRNGWQNRPQGAEPARKTWWTGDYPKNIGIVTGEPSGIFVVDVDPKGGGNETMAALVAEHGNEWLKTYTVTTGSGGFHFYFQYPDDFAIGNSASTKLGKGIDTRGTGGFVVAPPSVSGVRDVKGGPVRPGPYSVRTDGPIISAPVWLLDLLRPKERKAPATPAPTNPSAVPDAERARLDGYTEGAVRKELDRLDRLHWAGDPAAYTGEPWDHTVFEVACNLIQLANADWNALQEMPTYDLFVQHAPTDSGFDAGRVDAKWESAKKKVGDNAAVYPPKPIDAFGFLAANATRKDIGPAPISTEDWPGTDVAAAPEQTASEPGSDWSVATPDAPTIPVVEIEATVSGVPVAAGVLDPLYVQRAAADLDPMNYTSKAPLEIMDDGGEIDPQFVVDTADPGEGVNQDVTAVQAWVRDALRSSSPAQLWRAVGVLAEGRVTDGPTIVFKGGGPLLAALTRRLRPSVGETPEQLLFGPVVSTKDVPGPKVVFEFAEVPAPDLDAVIDGIIAEGYRALMEPEVGEDGPPVFNPDQYADYRSAQLRRIRLGLGTSPRIEEDSDAPQE